MRSSAQGEEFWEKVVSEARSGVGRAELLARYGITKAALKYHLYKKPARGRKKSAPTMLPVRVTTETRWLELEVGSELRLRFVEGCDASYVAAVVSKLR